MRSRETGHWLILYLCANEEIFYSMKLHTCTQVNQGNCYAVERFSLSSGIREGFPDALKHNLMNE